MHFYTPDGTPVYEEPCKSKTAKNPTKPTTIKYAIEHNLLPSVTEVDKCVLPNEGINIWKNSMVIQWCLDNPIEENETREEYQKRCLDNCFQKSRDAMDFGSLIHDSIEAWVVDPQAEIDARAIPWVDSVKEFLVENHIEPEEAEVAMGCKYFAIGGKMDLACNIYEEPFVLDWKTQDVKEKKGKKTPAFYPSWIRQLATYSAMYFLREEKEDHWSERILTHPQEIVPQMRRCASVVIDSNEPGNIWMKEWGVDEQTRALQTFLAMVKVWCLDKNYIPKGTILFSNYE